MPMKLFSYFKSCGPIWLESDANLHGICILVEYVVTDIYSGIRCSKSFVNKQSMDGSTLHYDLDVGGESSSSLVPVDKPVIVRVKRKASQSPLDALLLEISERPSKRPLVDFLKLSISSHSYTGKVDLIRRVLVQHVQTVDSSEAAMDILRSLAQPGGDNGTKVSSTANTLKNASKQHQLLAKAKQEQAIGSSKKCTF
ncbi:hypothetical protein Droror1_Dr00014887 [Drosera rotundifolia]